MKIEALLDRVHSKVTGSGLMLRATAGVRALLSVGFLAPGLTKLLGHRFTSEVTDDAIGRFFEVLYQTGIYWRFLGATQVLAACLILSTRTAATGSLLFFGITLNIFIITISLPFGNTAIITGLMLLASCYLVLWDFPRWKQLFFSPSSRPPAVSEAPSLKRYERIGFSALVLGGWGVTCVMRGLVTWHYLAVFRLCLALALAGAATVVLTWIGMVVSPAGDPDLRERE